MANKKLGTLCGQSYIPIHRKTKRHTGSYGYFWRNINHIKHLSSLRWGDCSVLITVKSKLMRYYKW